MQALQRYAPRHGPLGALLPQREGRGGRGDERQDGRERKREERGERNEERERRRERQRGRDRERERKRERQRERREERETKREGEGKVEKRKRTPTGSRIQAFTSPRRPGGGASPRPRGSAWKGDMLNHYTIGAGGGAREANP